MRLRLTILATALVAVAGIAPAAASAEGNFTAEKYPADLSASPIGELNFVVPVSPTVSREISCSEVQLAGPPALSGPAVSIQLLSTWHGCTARFTGQPSVPATVQVNGCLLQLAVQTIDTATTATGGGTLSCPVGKELVIDTYKDASEHGKGNPACTYLLKSQSQTGSFESHNRGTGSKEGVELTLGLGNSAYLSKGTFIACGIPKEMLRPMNLVGVVTLAATHLGGPLGLMIG